MLHPGWFLGLNRKNKTPVTADKLLSHRSFQTKETSLWNKKRFKSNGFFDKRLPAALGQKTLKYRRIRHTQPAQIVL